jgi:hypothetical protein
MAYYDDLAPRRCTGFSYDHNCARSLCTTDLIPNGGTDHDNRFPTLSERAVLNFISCVWGSQPIDSKILFCDYG